MMRPVVLGAVAALSSVGLSQQVLADGAQLFEDNCAICHNAGGTGTPGLAPALDRPEFWQALGDDAGAYVSTVVTKGFNMPITVRGERYAGMPMIPVTGVSDDDLALISTWVLAELGGLDQTVSADDIATARGGALSNADLKALRPESE
ncbi:c-type cytochrome [Microbulbifer sp. S227A]|uniref:c-type cytochrome n=1 Tax=Microbulbifer sp. S227A TaxID=3415131 RepID=UPI003C7D5784